MNNRRLNRILTCLFFFAMFMGPGPGLLLVNPDREAANTNVMGIPIIYAWGLLWYAVLVGIILAAYILVWRHDDDVSDEEQP